MDFQTFTTDLKNYKENEKRLKQAKFDLEQILYDLCNVKGISYDQVMVHGNPSQKALNWLKLEDRYNDKEAEVLRYETAMQNVDMARRRLPERLWSICYQKYVMGKTFRELGIRYGYSDHGMYQYLRRECERYL